MKQWVCIVLVLVMASCIDAFKYHPVTEPAIVVDGMITNLPGPYLVKFYETKAFGDQWGDPQWITSAQLIVTDDTGLVDTLKEISPGHYETTFIQGIVGRTYKLRVTTTDENVYESLPEKLLPVGEILSLSHHFEMNEPYIPDQKAGLMEHVFKPSKNGFRILIDSRVLSEQEGRVCWRYTATFAIHTTPYEIYPDPPPCGGSEELNCTCCRCWVQLRGLTPELEELNAPGDITGRPLAFIPADYRAFYDRYIFTVEQFSLSESAYAFWEQVGKAQQVGSDLFQTPPAKTTGNITRLSSGDGPRMIGLFSAGSVRSATITLTAADVPYVFVDEFQGDICRVLYFPRSSSTKPDFY